MVISFKNFKFLKKLPLLKMDQKPKRNQRGIKNYQEEIVFELNISSYFEYGDLNFF